jgi:Domain of unknown function (DUF4136)
VDIEKFAIKFILKIGFCLLVLQLAGCAGVRLVDSEVTAFSTLPASPAAPAASSSSPTATSLPASASGTRTISAASTTFSATYRFERLPSQQTDTARQDRLEALAQSALDKVGLVRVGDAPGSPKARFTLQMGISVLRGSRPVNGWYGDDFGVGLGAPFGSHLGGYVTVGVGSPGFYGGHYSGFPGAFPGSFVYLPPPYYVREVSLVLREASSGAVVFESRAKHEGPWHDSLAILPAMFDAALQGFPQPPAGLRRVVVEIAR